MSQIQLALALDGARPSVPTAGTAAATTAELVHHVREAEVGLLDLVTLDVPEDRAPDEAGSGLGGGVGAVLAAVRLAAATRTVGLLPTVHAGRTEPWTIARAVHELHTTAPGRAGVLLRVPVPADEQGWVQAVRRSWPAGSRLPVVALPGRGGRDHRALPADAADLGFVAPRTTVDAQQLVAAARSAGAPRHLLGDLVVVIDDSSARARQRWERSTGEAPSTAPEGARVFAGTPGQLADLALGWRAAGLAGLRLHPVDPARDVRGVTRGLVPELQRRRAFRRSYRGADLRDRLGEPAAAAAAA